MCYGEKIDPNLESKEDILGSTLDSNIESNYLVMDTNRFVDLDINTIERKYEVNFDKPLRCASYYKIDDLKKISNQLHLPFENSKKQQLYNSIENVLNKLNI